MRKREQLYAWCTNTLQQLNLHSALWFAELSYTYTNPLYPLGLAPSTFRMRSLIMIVILIYRSQYFSFLYQICLCTSFAFKAYATISSIEKPGAFSENSSANDVFRGRNLCGYQLNIESPTSGDSCGAYLNVKKGNDQYKTCQTTDQGKFISISKDTTLSAWLLITLMVVVIRYPNRLCKY